MQDPTHANIPSVNADALLGGPILEDYRDLFTEGEGYQLRSCKSAETCQPKKKKVTTNPPDCRSAQTCQKKKVTTDPPDCRSAQTCQKKKVTTNPPDCRSAQTCQKKRKAMAAPSASWTELPN